MLNSRPLIPRSAARIAILAAAVALLATGCSNPPAARTGTWPTVSPPEQPQIDTSSDDDIGIRFESIRLTAANYLLNFRYLVTNPEKAALLINREIKPYLVDESSGARLYVATPPKVGSLRHTGSNLVAGRSYFALFANPGKYIQPGSSVTVVIGDLRLEHLTVE